MRHQGKTLRVRNQTIKEGVVELLVDQPGARTLQLVAHSAGTPDLNVERFVVSLNSLSDCLAEHVATPPGGRRVLHDVHRKRDHWTRPRLWLAAHQAQWHGQAMVDIHLVNDGKIEVVLDHRLRDVRGELRMADHFRDWTRTPTLVGGREFGRRADRESWDYIEAECVGVVVIDQENGVRLLILQPLLGELVSLEDRLPIRLGALSQVERGADR